MPKQNMTYPLQFGLELVAGRTQDPPPQKNTKTTKTYPPGCLATVSALQTVQP